MGKPVSVFAFDANPSIDSPKFFTSHADRKERVSRYGYLHLSDFAIQEPFPPGYEHDARAFIGASMRSAWAVRESAGFLVWQMNRSRDSATT
jgi:hypothetical protein